MKKRSKRKHLYLTGCMWKYRGMFKDYKQAANRLLGQEEQGKESEEDLIEKR